LEAVFAIVMHYKVRRRTARLLRHAFKFARLSFDPHVDPFTAIMQCTTGGDVDSKTISKYARALRYVARRKEPDMRLKRFMKKMGGVNACVSLYAKQLGRNNRVAAISGELVRKGRFPSKSPMSAFGGKADVANSTRHVCF
jgi:hypothetical protein